MSCSQASRHRAAANSMQHFVIAFLQNIIDLQATQASEAVRQVLSPDSTLTPLLELAEQSHEMR